MSNFINLGNTVINLDYVVRVESSDPVERESGPIVSVADLLGGVTVYEGMAANTILSALDDLIVNREVVGSEYDQAMDDKQ